MRARLLHPGFFKNADLVALSPLHRLLFAGLWGLCDRDGRLRDKPSSIKIEVLPCDNCDVDAMLNDLAAADMDPDTGVGLLVRYKAEHERCIWLPGFVRHQNPHIREKPSGLPPPSLDQHSAGTGSAPVSPGQHSAGTGSAPVSPGQHSAGTGSAPDSANTRRGVSPTVTESPEVSGPARCQHGASTRQAPDRPEDSRASRAVLVLDPVLDPVLDLDQPVLADHVTQIASPSPAEKPFGKNGNSGNPSTSEPSHAALSEPTLDADLPTPTPETRAPQEPATQATTTVTDLLPGRRKAPDIRPPRPKPRTPEEQAAKRAAYLDSLSPADRALMDAAQARIDAARASLAAVPDSGAAA